VLGDARAADRERRGDLAGRAFPLRDKLDDAPARGVRECLERGHAITVTSELRNCQVTEESDLVLLKAAVICGLIGGAVAIAFGILFIVPGGLAGFAENPDGQDAVDVGRVLLLLGLVAVAGVFAARNRPVWLAAIVVVVAALGFLVDRVLWPFVAAILAATAALSLLSLRVGD
jgi:hypothetical protein